MDRFLGIALLAALCLSPACSGLGPSAVRTSRTDYNVALRRSEDEQLLLNLVRLRYRDQALFLEASALTTQFTYAQSADGSVLFGADVDNVFTVGGGVLVEERPTVTYTPLQGEGFVERVLRRIPVETLVLLDGSGWSSDRVLRTCVDRMNGIENALGADGPTPAAAPRYEQFLKVCGLLRTLEKRGLVTGGRLDGDKLALFFEPAATELPEFEELATILRLEPEVRICPITTDHDARPGELGLRTRSFLGVMYYLSQSVDVPEAHVEAGYVTVTRDAEGRPFDWHQVTDGIMRVRSSPEPPEQAAVAIPYRGHWFYIDDSDLDSKSTFSMLGQVFALQSGKTNTEGPQLTLPVGG